MNFSRSQSVDFGSSLLNSCSLNKKRGSWTGPSLMTATGSSSSRPRSTDSFLAVKMTSIAEKAANQINNSALSSMNNLTCSSLNDLNNSQLKNKRISFTPSDSTEKVSIFQLSKDGDYEALLSVLDFVGASATNHLNQLNEDRLSPLHYAARYNHINIVRLLVERGAIVHIRGEDGLTPLHYAAKYNFPKRIKSRNQDYHLVTTRKDGLIKLFVDDNFGLKEEMEERMQKANREKKSRIESHKSHQFINKNVKRMGKPLQKLRNKKYSKSMDDYVYDSGVVLTGTTLGNNNSAESGEPESLPVPEDDVIRYLVSQMAEVNSKDDYSLTPLHYAAIRGNSSAAKSLLSCQGVNIEARDAEEMTPLHLAAIHNNAKIANLLLKAGAQLRCRDENLTTPLHHAATEGNLAIIQMLITTAEEREGWKSVHDMTSDRDCEQARPLHNAVECRHLECANYLLAKGSDANAPKQNSVFPLHLAAKNGDDDLVRSLLNNTKQVDCVKANGETPLHEASKHNHVTVIEILIQNGADVEFKDKHGFTPLLTAAHHGNVEAIEFLLSKGAQLRATDNEDKTAIYWATAQNKHDALMTLLDEAPGSHDLIKSTDRYGNSPLHVATLKGYAVITQCLLDLGAPIEIRNDLEQTPLHLAAWHGRTKIVKDLLWRNKSVINLVDEDGNTPLHIAALSGHENVVKLLIEAGATLDTRNARLWTPLDCASSRGYVNTVKLLLDSGCPIDPQEKTRVTPLHLAASNGNVAVVALLLENGADITRKDDQMRNPLEIAIDNSRKDIAKVIIQSAQWDRALKGGSISEQGLMKTPLRKLILKMPEIAEEVFQRCSSNNGFPSDHPLYTVSFNYEFIDDSYNEYAELEDELNNSTKEDDNSQENKTLNRAKPTNDMIKRNHPLMLMVRSKRVQLLTHPVCVSLLHLKWMNFGRYVYYTNFILYFIFLIFLTGYILTVTPPIVGLSSNATTIMTFISGDRILECAVPIEMMDATVFVQTGKYVVIVLATLHLVKELFQIVISRWNYIGLENLTEVACFTTSLLLMIDFDQCTTHTGIREKWQWEAGTIAIFLAWVNLVMFISKFPYLGLYVVMFGDVVRTFCKVCVVFFLFIVAFAMGFYTVLYYNPSYNPLSMSIMRVMVMMLGEFNFDDIFSATSLLYTGPSYFLFFIFMILVCILTMNLLVGLAVDDIKTVQAQATLKRLAMQVELVLNVESMMPGFLQHRFVLRDYSFMPNLVKKTLYRRFIQKINSTESLSEILSSPEKFRDNTSGSYRCKKNEIDKVLEQQEMLFEFSKGLENNINSLQSENKKLNEMLVTLLQFHGVEMGEGEAATEST